MKFIEKYPNQTVRALSWKQPFASLMLHGKVETRVWDSKYLGWVLICASKAWYSGSKCEEIAGEQQMERINKIIEESKCEEFPTGKAIAIGKLVRSTTMKNAGLFGGVQNTEDKCFVTFNSDLYMHIYEDVQPIVPFYWKGKQGWSTLDEETKSKIILL